jgi:hypothetical protein
MTGVMRNCKTKDYSAEEEDRGLDWGGGVVGGRTRPSGAYGGGVRPSGAYGGGVRPSGAYGAGCALPNEGPEAGECGFASEQPGLEVELARAIELLQPSERNYYANKE